MEQEVISKGLFRQDCFGRRERQAVYHAVDLSSADQ